MVRFIGMLWPLFLHGTQRFASAFVPWLMVVVMALSSVACAGAIPTDELTVQARWRFGVCTLDPDIEQNATSWAYPKPELPAVSNLHPYEYNRAILSSGVVYYYDPFAPAQSVKVLPIRLSALPCDRMHTVELRPALRRACSDSICKLAWPSAFDLPNGGTCSLEQTESTAPPISGNWFGQTEPTIRSTYFCNTEPLSPKNAPQRMLDKESEAAWLEGFFYGYRVSLLLTQAEADAQAFINKSDPWIVRLFKKDPGSVEAILQRLAAMLDAIPEPPQYETRHEAFYAADGYAAGARRGAAEVEATLILIEATAIVAEVALMELVLGPLGGANALRAALMRLRHIPVFIPGAAGGLGGFVRVAKATHTATLWSAWRLAANMKRAKILRPPGWATHHIVAHGDKRAIAAQKILAKFKIDLDEAVNGVFLPATKKTPNPTGATVHSTLHTNAYFEAVTKELEGLTTKKEVIAKLREIADQLTKGTFL
ncbi:MAG: AHH domain-containing protein [Polyangiaceae bacterium]|nr:AHH domain-containing protein [Polyangiaceae bacterium]